MKQIDDFLRALPDDRRAALQHLRELTQKTCPEAIEGFGYGMPGYKYRGRPLIYFSSFKSHLSIFALDIGSHLAELADYEIRATTLRFQAAQPVPDKLMKTMIRERMSAIDAQLSRPPSGRSRA